MHDSLVPVLERLEMKSVCSKYVSAFQCTKKVWASKSEDDVCMRPVLEKWSTQRGRQEQEVLLGQSKTHVSSSKSRTPEARNTLAVWPRVRVRPSPERLCEYGKYGTTRGQTWSRRNILLQLLGSFLLHCPLLAMLILYLAGAYFMSH